MSLKSEEDLEDSDVASVLALLDACVQSNQLDHEAALSLEQLAKSQELRDIELDSQSFVTRFERLLKVSISCVEPQQLVPIINTTKHLFSYPEFTDEVRCKVLSEDVADLALERATLGVGDDMEISFLLLLVYETYRYNVPARSVLRRRIATVLSDVQDAKFYKMLPGLLSLIRSVVEGFSTPMSNHSQSFLLKSIMPLHSVQGKLSPTEPIIGLFHRELVLCVVSFLEKEPALLNSCLEQLIALWPTNWEGNSPKEVLFLHEMEALLENCQSSKVISPKLISKVSQRLAECISSDNSTVCERALLYWKNESAIQLLLTASPTLPVLDTLLKPVVQNALTHWNQTVTIMAANVIGFQLEDSPEKVLEITTPLLIKKGLVNPKEPIEPQLHHLIERIRPKMEQSMREVDSGSGKSGSIREGYIGTEVPAKLHDVSFMNMVVGDELGEGSFSKVFHAFKVLRGKPKAEWPSYALKRMDVKHRSIAEREIAMMDRIRHPNCTRLVATYESAGSINLVMEYAQQGDLHACIASVGTLDAPSTRFIGAEIAAALDAVHKENLIFGDLKPENVLVHNNGHVKLGDFGATREMSSIMTGDQPLEGTLCFLAPELFQQRSLQELVEGRRISYPEGIDWWAFGSLIYHMLTGRPPLWVEEEKEMIKHMVKFHIDRFPQGFPEDAKSLVTSLLQRDPSKRLGSQEGIIEIQDHSFFRPLGIKCFHDVHKHKAPDLSAGKVKAEHGPWSQRTYSMMITPLPSSYSSESVGHIGMYCSIPETSAERPTTWEPYHGEESQLRAKFASSLSPVQEVDGVLKESNTLAQSPFKLPELPKPNPFQFATAFPRSVSGPQRPVSRLKPSMEVQKAESKSKLKFKGLDLTAG